MCPIFAAAFSLVVCVLAASQQPLSFSCLARNWIPLLLLLLFFRWCVREIFFKESQGSNAIDCQCLDSDDCFNWSKRRRQGWQWFKCWRLLLLYQYELKQSCTHHKKKIKMAAIDTLALPLSPLLLGCISKQQKQNDVVQFKFKFVKSNVLLLHWRVHWDWCEAAAWLASVRWSTKLEKSNKQKKHKSLLLLYFLFVLWFGINFCFLPLSIWKWTKKSKQHLLVFWSISVRWFAFWHFRLNVFSIF